MGPGAIVCADGKELLVYAPGDEAPLWKRALPAAVAGVAVAGDHVLAIDARGTLVRLAADTGAEASKETFIGEPRALAARDGDAFAVALEDSVVVVTGDARVTLPIAGATCLAFSAKLLAIGTDAGAVHVIDGEATVAKADLGSPVRGVVRHAAGSWLATAKDAVLQVGDDGVITPFTRASGRAPAAIACARDGSLVAVQLDAREVAVLAYPAKETLATAKYVDRDATGIALTADGRFLWIGLEKGDANKVDLDLNDIYRTDPHPGRTRGTWVLKVQIDKGARARAKAGAATAPKTASPAPTPTPTPLAAHASSADTSSADAPSGPPEPVMPPSPEGDKRLVLAVSLAIAAVGLLSVFVGR